ncbi:hypothetical protein QUO03_000033 [Vibrio parahaemolyticus]|nr:hypothetical protein [Vibrio parahaemolyticus]
MNNLNLEIWGDYSDEVEDVFNNISEQLAENNISMNSLAPSSTRNADIIALVVSIISGAASLSQIASIFLKSLKSKESVKLVIVDKKGKKTEITHNSTPEDIAKLIDTVTKEERESK